MARTSEPGHASTRAPPCILGCAEQSAELDCPLSPFCLASSLFCGPCPHVVDWLVVWTRRVHNAEARETTPDNPERRSGDIWELPTKTERERTPPNKENEEKQQEERKKEGEIGKEKMKTGRRARANEVESSKVPECLKVQATHASTKECALSAAHCCVTEKKTLGNSLTIVTAAVDERRADSSAQSTRL